MILKGVAGCLTVLLVGVAILGYTPIPEGMEDPYKVQIYMGYYKLYMLAISLKAMVLGTPSQAVALLAQETIITEGDVASASYGDNMKVTRDKLAGVPVIIYKPAGAPQPSPAVIYLHGGGWVTGTADLYDDTVYAYANFTGVIFVSVDYRRAPQNPFPAPFKDCYDVTHYVLTHGKEYGIDVNKVGVMGDSAGGNLAAAVTVKISKEKSKAPPLALQALHYPSLQSLNLRLPSYIDHNTTLYILPQISVAAYLALHAGLDIENMNHYALVISENRHISPQLRKSKYAEYIDVGLLPKRFQTPNKTVPSITAPFDVGVFNKIKHIVTNPAFSPLMAEDLTGLPPSFIHVCEFDPVRDDGLLYAERLKRAGVKVQVFFGRGGFHTDVERVVPSFLFTRSGDMAFRSAGGFIKKIFKV